MQGNFLAMPFEDSSFDGAYAIEATCHAPKVSHRPRSCWIAKKLKPKSLLRS